MDWMEATRSVFWPRSHAQKVLRLGVFSIAVFLAGLNYSCGKRPEPTIAPEDIVEPKDVPPLPDVALELTTGERLGYDMYLGLAKVGESAMTVEGREEKDGHQVYRVTNVGESKGTLAERLYPVEFRQESWIDAEGGFTRGFKGTEVTKDEDKSVEMTFDYEEGKAYVDFNKYEKDEDDWVRLDPVHEIPEGVHDGLSLFYLIRSLDLKPGESSEPFVAAVNRKVYTIQVKAIEYEDVEVTLNGKKRTMRTLKVIPKPHQPGAFSKHGDMTIWLEEKSRLPVKIKVDLPVASLVSLIKSAENAPLE